MIRGTYLSGNGELKDIYELRRQVFCLELGMDRGMERDGLDSVAVHALVFEKGIPAAAGRILYDGEVFRIDRIAVRKELRGRGLGDFVMRMLMNRALLSGANEIYISAAAESRKFFNKLGFVNCQDSYEEAGTILFPMWLREIPSHTCCGCQS